MGETGRLAPRIVRGRIRRPVDSGLRRDRILSPLRTLGTPRLIVVVAPAGAGKTTMLTHLAVESDLPTAWLTLDGHTSDRASLLLHLAAACSQIAPGLLGGWDSPEEGLSDLESGLAQRSLLVIDDVHLLDSPTALEVLEQLIRYQPTRLDLALAGRALPRLNLLARAMQGSVHHVDADALRFRTWEVEELFRGCYGTRLGYDEVASLTQRTDGWAAGLQLFHLATVSQPPSRRRAVLAGTGQGNRLTRDYLARHLLDTLDAPVRDFLVRTSVFDRLTMGRCDRLLEMDRSHDFLDELDRRGVFTEVEETGAGVAFRYHDVLRSHLLNELSLHLGGESSRDLHARAAAILKEEGALTGAIRAYCIAQRWEEVRHLLTTGGRRLASSPGAWLDALPASICERDPWVHLALARRALSDGSLDLATQAYRTAVGIDADPDGALEARQELRSVQAWTEPTYGVVHHWVHDLRRVLKDSHAVGSSSGSDPTRGFSAALAELLRGELTSSERSFAHILDDVDLSPVLEAVALLGRALALSIAIAPDRGAACDEAVSAAKLVEIPALLRAATGLQTLATGQGLSPIEHLLAEGVAVHDEWGTAFLRLGRALAVPDHADVGSDLRRTGEFFREQDATTLAAWTRGLEALTDAAARDDTSSSRVSAIERECRAVGPLPYAIALSASGPPRAESAESSARHELALNLADRCGGSRLLRHLTQRPAKLGTDVVNGVPRTHGPTSPRLRATCLGELAVEVDGAPVDLTRLRPLHRSVLRFFCLHANELLTRDRLVEQHWPDQDPARTGHLLHVAISELRRTLEPRTTRGGWTLLIREHSGYRLRTADREATDVATLLAHLRDADAARIEGRVDQEVSAVEAAIESYSRELFEDDESTDWVVLERDQLRHRVASACARLADLRSDAGNFSEAAAIAERGLTYDHYRDGLWRRLISSLEETQDHLALAGARRSYAQAMVEMGMSPDTQPVDPPGRAR